MRADYAGHSDNALRPKRKQAGQSVPIVISIQILLVSCFLLGLIGQGCFHRQPTGEFNWAQYSPVELPLSAEAQKARSMAVSYMDRDGKRDTSDFSISVLQDSLNYVVDFSPLKTSYVDSAGKLWVVCARGYAVVIRKSDLSVARVWVT